MKRARITGTGSSIPERILTNSDLEKMVDTTDEWIVTRTGIRERHLADEGVATSDLASEAARKALAMAGVDPREIDLIVVGTITGDFPWPATACMVQNNLGAKGATAFDVSAACSGFLFALDCAVKRIETGASRKALVIGAEILSRIVDWQDRNTCVLFGDGAGAVVLEGQEGDNGVLSTHLHSDGSFWELLYQPGFGSRSPVSEGGIKDRIHYLRMKGNEVFKVAVRSLHEVAVEAIEANSMTAADVDLFIPHQANRRILEATAKRLGMTDEQIYINVDRYGNTSSASIPIALDEANRDGRINEGNIVLLDTFGGGFTWASALIRW